MITLSRESYKKERIKGFIESVARKMEKEGLTQVQVSARTGIAKSNINAYLRGKKSPNESTMKTICKGLNLDYYEASISLDLLGGGMLVNKDVLKIYPEARRIIEEVNERARRKVKASELIEWVIKRLELELIDQRMREHSKRPPPMPLRPIK